MNILKFYLFLFFIFQCLGNKFKQEDEEEEDLSQYSLLLNNLS